MTNEIDDNYDDFDVENYEPFDLNDFLKNIANCDSESLCARIACNRYFGSYKELAVICMEELSARRIAGEDFNFEEDIERKYNSLAEENKLDFTIPNLNDIITKILNEGSGK